VLTKGDSYTSESGSTLSIVEGAADNGGARLVFDRVMPPGKGRGEPHLHLDCDQRYEIDSGAATIEVDGEKRALGPGDRIEVPRGTGHRDPYNESDKELCFRVEIEPCPPFIDAFGRGLGESFESRQLTAQDELPLLKIFVITHAYDGQSYRTGIPIPLQRAGAPLLAAVGRLRGYRAPSP
jgi:mannose-6-phosphate isomerase-like protein (cupin superfamily)